MTYLPTRATAVLVVIAVLFASVTFSGAAVAQDRDEQDQDGPIDDAFDYIAHMVDSMGWHNNWGDHSHGDHWNDHQTKAQHEGHGPDHPDDGRPHS